MIKVLLVVPLPPPYGGITHWASMLLQALQDRTDVKYDVLDTSPRWRDFHDYVLLERLVGGARQLLLDYIRFVRVFGKKFDVVHIATSIHVAVVRDLLFLLTLRIFGIRSVYHIHMGRVPEMAEARTIEWYFFLWAVKLANTVIAIDSKTLDVLASRLPSASVRMVPNGVDFSAFPVPTQHCEINTLLYLGHIMPSKGIDELLFAWDALQLQGWRCQLVGKAGEAYRKELLKRTYLENVEIFPEVSHGHAMQFLANADVLVLPSHTEGFPYVVIEGMASGKPIIATSVGAVPEMLGDSCGILVPPHDANALKKALNRVCSDFSLRLSMGENGRRKAQSLYSVERVVDQLLLIWSETASGNLR